MTLTVVLDKTHWMMYWLVTAMYPQFLITVDEELQEKAITVRVGQAVNTVGLAGQRMGISGVSLCAILLLRMIRRLTCPVFSSKPIKPLSESLLASGQSLVRTSTSLTLRHWKAL